jgi:hypothetical protein
LEKKEKINRKKKEERKRKVEKKYEITKKKLKKNIFYELVLIHSEFEYAKIIVSYTF